jgi:membrane protein required for colicin V production
VNVVDLIILVVLISATFGGYVQGFIVQVATILGVLAGLTVAHLEYLDVRRLLAQVAPGSRWLTVIAYLIVFFIVWAAIILLARRLRRIARMVALGWMDRIGGAIIGFLQGILLVELLISLGQRAPGSDLHRAIHQSALAPTFEHALPYLSGLFPHVSY